MEGLQVLTNVAIILLLGLLISLLSQKWKISNVLLLVLTGAGLQFMKIDGNPVFGFDADFLVGVSILALVMIVFDSTSRVKWRDLDDVSLVSLKLVSYFTGLSLLILGTFTMLLVFSQVSMLTWLYSLIFAAVMVATDPSSIFIMLGGMKNKIIHLLEVESLANTPLTVILPFIFLDLIATIGTEVDFMSAFLKQVGPFVLQIVAGVGTGIVLGIVVFKIMRKAYSEQFSPLALITAALLAYIIAENIGGSGVLSVATLGLFFGSVYVKQKASLQEFSSMLSNSLEILVFVLIGLMVPLNLTGEFLFKSLILFVVLLICRGLAVFYALRNDGYGTGQKMFAILNMPKGIAMAVVVFTLHIWLTQFGSMELAIVLEYMLALLVYSLILSTIVTTKAKLFIELEEEPQPK